MPDYNLLGSQDVLEELQEGRTRELLLLLQDKPVPEVVDPMSLQTSLSTSYTTDGVGDYLLSGLGTELSTASRTADNNDPPEDQKTGIVFNPNRAIQGVEAVVSSNTTGVSTAYLTDTALNVLDTDSVSGSGDVARLSADMSAGTKYYALVDNGGETYTSGYYSNGAFPYTSQDVDIVTTYDGADGESSSIERAIKSVTAFEGSTSGYVTDEFSAPTTSPADFKQWNAIRAEDVTTGGSTSTNPVEFEIRDSTDTALTSSRIPASEIADSAFRLRNREVSTTAGSDGQADYQIPETGAGGHFGLPILSVVTVEQNGSVLDPSVWEFDGTNSVTIDTSSVSITSGDSFTISYDFDVFDSTLQPRAYLSRESADETSPSISHFRYEYVI